MQSRAAPASEPGWRRTWGPGVYLLLLLATFGLFLLIRAHGETLHAPPPDAGAQSGIGRSGPGGNDFLHVLLALATVVLVGQVLGKLFRFLQQPPVIGEVVAGIVLGPSILHRLSPELGSFLLPMSIAPTLGVLSQLGVILYMFLIGLELDLRSLGERAATLLTISHASITLPFLMGAGLAIVLYPRLSTNDVAFTSFALFLGVAMSITAFPVLARILSDQRIDTTPFGVLALGCAAMGDVTAWCLLALVVGVAQEQIGGALLVLGLTTAYLLGMLLIVRPLAVYLFARMDERELSRPLIGGVFVAVLLSALATELIGIHAIFGAFLLGAVIPNESAVARAFVRKLEDLVTVLLLPAFFAFTGLRTQISLVSGLDQWLVCGLIIVVATAGKLGGTLAAARATGLAWRDATGLGILMNTRGLMELIVLNVGLDLRVISPTLFAMMVVMALVTTLMTSPILRWLRPPMAFSKP